MHNNTLLLYRNDQVLGRLLLGDSPVEVGPSPDADLVVDEPEHSALLIQPRGGTVWMFALGDRTLKPRVLPIGRRIPVGTAHFLVREVERPLDRSHGREPGPEQDDPRTTQRLEHAVAA